MKKKQAPPPRDVAYLRDDQRQVMRILHKGLKIPISQMLVDAVDCWLGLPEQKELLKLAHKKINPP